MTSEAKGREIEPGHEYRRIANALPDEQRVTRCSTRPAFVDCERARNIETRQAEAT